MRASPCDTGVLVSCAAFSSTQASTPAGSSYREMNVPWLVRTSLRAAPGRRAPPGCARPRLQGSGRLPARPRARSGVAAARSAGGADV